MWKLHRLSLAVSYIVLERCNSDRISDFAVEVVIVSVLKKPFAYFVLFLCFKEPTYSVLEQEF